MGPHRRRDDRPYRPRSGELPRSDVNLMAVWSQYGYNRRTVAYPGTVFDGRSTYVRGICPQVCRYP